MKLKVLNMSCANCAAHVQKALQKQPGVISANVNFANQTASIEYDSALTNVQKLRKAVQEAGYDLAVDTENEDENKQRYRRMKIRTFAALILSAGLIVLSMTSLANLSWAGYAEGILATLVLFVCGRSFFIDAYRQAKHRRMNMNTLVALSTATAYVFSIFGLLYPQFQTGRGIHAGLYFETAGVLIAFILIGKLLEESAKRKTSDSIGKLLGLQVKTATIIRSDGSIANIDIQDIDIHDIIWVKAGEKIPIDGVVTDGHSFVDESMITGEPVPVEKTRGQHVFAGTINQHGSFKFRVTKLGNETLLAQIIRLVGEAQNTKAPIQKIVDRITGIFVPAVAVIATLSALLWILFGGDDAWVHAFLAFVTVLIIACPCALGLATPTAIMVGMGKGAGQGILIKDTVSLETLRKVDTIVLDKTGTVTQGVPKVTDMQWMVPETEELRRILFGMEQSSGHPLAKAIIDAIPNAASPPDSFAVEILAGKGVKTSVENANYYVGNSLLFASAGNRDEALEWTHGKEPESHTIVMFGTDRQIMAVFAVSDEIKPSSRQSVEQLQASGIEIVMATGDNENAAQAIARQAGIREVLAQALPEDKLRLVKEKQQTGKTVAMVGDGINDSAALAQANVSIAMGKGSDIAIETADITIVSGDLRKIATAIRLSRDTVATIRQNLFWAFIYNLIGIPVAAGILYPVAGFLLNPMIAGAAMALSSVSVVLNSLRANCSSFRRGNPMMIFFPAAVLFSQATVFAQTDSLPQYLNIAAENNPGVKAGFLTYQAALQKVPQAGALQDPQLDLGFFFQPMEIIDGKQAASVELMQMFPWFGTRKAARTEARHMAQMAFEQFREARDKLFLDVYTQWFTLCRLQQQLANNRENRKLLMHLEELALRKFTAGNATSSGERQMAKGEGGSAISTNAMSGMNMNTPPLPSALSPSPSIPSMMSQMSNTGGMSEVLQIRMEIAEIDNNMENILSEIQAEKARFNALLNRPAESGVQIPDSLQQIPFLFDISAAKIQIANQNPMLAMIDEEESAYRAKAEMDRKMSYPMFGIGLQYMFINKKTAPDGGMSGMNSMNGKDMIMPMASISIPIYRNKYRAQQRENAFLQQANRAKYIDAQNMLEAELYRVKHQLDDAARRIALYRKQTELAQTAFNLMIREFASGKNDLSSVIQIQRQLLDYELKTAEAVAGYNTTVANIQKLMSMLYAGINE